MIRQRGHLNLYQYDSVLLSASFIVKRKLSTLVSVYYIKSIKDLISLSPLLSCHPAKLIPKDTATNTQRKKVSTVSSFHTLQNDNSAGSPISYDFNPAATKSFRAVMWSIHYHRDGMSNDVCHHIYHRTLLVRETRSNYRGLYGLNNGLLKIHPERLFHTQQHTHTQPDTV